MQSVYVEVIPESTMREWESEGTKPITIALMGRFLLRATKAHSPWDPQRDHMK